MLVHRMGLGFSLKFQSISLVAQTQAKPLARGLAKQDFHKMAIGLMDILVRKKKIKLKLRFFFF